MNKRYFFQGGGFIPQVFNVNPLSQGINVNLSGVHQAAAMPVNPMVNEYINMENLDLNRQREELHRQEFKNRILQQDKENAYRDLTHLNTLRDDVMGIEVLPGDGAILEEARNKYLTPELMEGIKRGDKDAMTNYIRQSTVFMTDPDVVNAIMRKKKHDANTKSYLEVAKQYDGYIRNSAEIIKAQMEGTPQPAPDIDFEGYAKDQELMREATRNEKIANTAKTSSQAQQYQYEAEKTKQIIDSRYNNAKKELGYDTIPEDQLTEQQKGQISAKTHEAEINLAKAETVLASAKAGALAAESTVLLAKLKEFEKLIAAGTDPDVALQSSGLAKTDIDYLLKKSIWNNPNLSNEQKIAQIKDIDSKSSTVTYNSNSPSIPSGGYVQTSKDGDRNYGNFITDSDGVEIKNVKINNSWFKKSDLPKELKFDIRGNGEAYIVLDGKTSVNNKFLKDYYGFDITDPYTLDYDYNDAIENGPLKGTGAYNLDPSGWRIAIPLHGPKAPAGTPATPTKTPVKTSGKQW